MQNVKFITALKLDLFFSLSHIFIFLTSCAPSAVHVLFSAFARRSHPHSFAQSFLPLAGCLRSHSLAKTNQQTVLWPEIGWVTCEVQTDCLRDTDRLFRLRLHVTVIKLNQADRYTVQLQLCPSLYPRSSWDLYFSFQPVLCLFRPARMLSLLRHVQVM